MRDNLAGADFSGSNLTNAFLESTTLTLAQFTNATVQGAKFLIRRDFLAQLASTASYAQQNLTGISLSGNILAGWDLSNQNLTNADFNESDLTATNLSGATVQGADFETISLTFAQLASTASYQQKNLAGIQLGGINAAGWDFSNQNLSGASSAIPPSPPPTSPAQPIQGASFRRLQPHLRPARLHRQLPAKTSPAPRLRFLT